MLQKITTVRTWSLFMGVLALLFLGCKKDDPTQQFEGRVQRGNTGGGLSGVQVQAQTQELGNGVFNSDYSTIGSTTTDGSGGYSIPFEVATYASLRLQFSKSQYHTRWVNVDPAYFEQNSSYTKNIYLYPQASVTLHISDGAPTYNAIQFRYKDTDFECTCCNDSWKVIEVPNVDTTFSCMVYGDQMVYYEYRWISANTDTLLQDSVYCPAFTTQNIAITY